MSGILEREVFRGEYDGTSVTVTICIALSLYNSLELLLLIFTTFSKWKGLYFWSLVISSFGVISYSLGLMMEYFNLTVLWAGKIFDSIGWITMITGQSFVLYSRLGLILADPRALKAVKWMIIIDGFLFHVIATILDYGSKYTRIHTFNDGYFYFEYIQMTGFCIQEFIISGLYVWKAVELIRIVTKKGTRRVMYQLFTINVVIIILDIALLVVQYKNWHIFEQTIKAFVYSVKLKLEFAVLGKLIDLVQSHQRHLTDALAEIDEHTERGRGSTASSHALRKPSLQWSSNSSASRNARLRTLTDKEVLVDTVHLEHMPNRGISGDLKKPQDFFTTAEDVITPHDPAASRNRIHGRESDVMYADMVRSIT